MARDRRRSFSHSLLVILPFLAALTGNVASSSCHQGWETCSFRQIATGRLPTMPANATFHHSSSVDCTRFCMELLGPSCNSLSHHRERQECRVYSNPYARLQMNQAEGYDFFDACQVMINDACEKTEDCFVSNSECRAGSCQCLPRYHANLDAETCDATVVGDSCSVTADCFPANSQCQAGTCRCLNQSHYDSTSQTCTLNATTVYEVNRVPLEQRQGYDWYLYSFTGDNPHFRITRSGEITQWKFFSSRAGWGNFEVWRPRSQDGALKFEFVGQNEIYSNVTAQAVTVDVEACKRIQVQAGDVIGVYYPWYRLGVERTVCNSKEEPGFDVVRMPKDVSELTQGSVYQFETDSCKIFSMTAVVGPVPMCDLPQASKNAVKVTSGDTVDVGKMAEYRCTDGFSLTSGDLTRKCSACTRKLEGTEPMCSAA